MPTTSGEVPAACSRGAAREPWPLQCCCCSGTAAWSVSNGFRAPGLRSRPRPWPYHTARSSSAGIVGRSRAPMGHNITCSAARALDPHPAHSAPWVCTLVSLHRFRPLHSIYALPWVAPYAACCVQPLAEPNCLLCPTLGRAQPRAVSNPLVALCAAGRRSRSWFLQP